MSGFQPGCRCKICVDRSKLNDFIPPSTTSTSRKGPVSCDVIIDQQFHIKAVHRKAVRTKPCCLFHVQGRGSFECICSFPSVLFHSSHSCCTRAVVLQCLEKSQPFCSAQPQLSPPEQASLAALYRQTQSFGARVSHFMCFFWGKLI